MTVLKKAKTREERNPEHRYVVFETRLGRYKPGIYWLHCSFAGNTVFVRPDKASPNAVCVPASVTFETRARAEAYLGSKGPLMWCCARLELRGGRARDMEIYQAHVKERFSTRYHYGRTSDWNTVVVRPNAKAPDQTYGIAHFAKKSDAERQLREWLKKDLAEVEKGLKEYRETARKLRALARRFRYV
jgi:hypothetical protein